QLYDAGVASTTPVPFARTWKVCGPSPCVGSESGLAQAVNAAPSTEHSKLTPVEPDENEKDGTAWLLGSEGFAVIVVSGTNPTDAVCAIVTESVESVAV